MRKSKILSGSILAVMLSGCSVVKLLETDATDLQGHWTVVDNPPLTSIVTGMYLSEADNMLAGRVFLSGRDLEVTGNARNLSFDLRTSDPVMVIRGRLTGERSMRVEVSTAPGETQKLELEKVDVIP